MEDFFGGSLIIKDAFSSTLTQFTNSITKSANSFKMFTSSIGESERANRLATQNMKSQIAQLSQTYAKEGYTMGQALKKATGEISREAPKSGSSWVDAFGRIKQVGTDAFGGITSKVQSFSNSTLGTITKLTAGFISLKTAQKGIEEGFKTGMEYQNLRIVMNSVYQDKEKGGKQFSMATKFASNSIWQEKDVVSSLALLKGLGLDDNESKLKQMSDIGSFAKARGVGDIKSATDAYGDMMGGEWERMYTILNIKRQQLEDFVKKNNMKKFDNKQGQITDKGALEEAFSAYLKQQGITGLSDKMANTATGKLSTLKDNIQKSLAELVGITNTGEVKDGSLFDKFTKGIGDMTYKIQQASENGNLEKLVNGISSIGGAISTGFSYLMEHPEIASDLIKLSVGLWALGKVGSVIGTFTSIIGAFSEGGALASLAPALAPIAPYVLAAVGTFIQLRSVLSPDGILHKSISWLLGKIPLVGDSLQSMFEELTSGINEFFSEAWEGWKIILGISPSDNKKDTYADDNSPWYEGKYAKADDKLQYKTASDLVKEGSITKASSNAYNNKTEVNVNIEKVEKTADIDEIGDAIVKRIDKHTQTRNNLDE